MINSDELLLVVDEDNNPVDPKPRHEVHKNGFWHRVAHVWIVNNNNELLCQRRSLLKEGSPGKWEPFFGGHMAPNMEYLDGAKVEVKEEVGIDLDETKLKLWKVYKNDRGHEFQGIYVYKWNGVIEDIVFEKDEIDQVRWFSMKEVSKFVLDTSENNWSKLGNEKDILEFIKQALV